MVHVITGLINEKIPTFEDMRFMQILRFFLLLLLPFNILAQADMPVRIISYNIRYDAAGDGTNRWPNRKDTLIAMLHSYAPEILGIQEALSNQMQDLKNGINGYQYEGVGRDDGQQAGEFSAIFYLNKRFKKIKGGTFWISQTPDVPGSRGWDAACVRICTWVQLKDLRNGKLLYVFNTHLDHVGDTARNMGTQLLLNHIKTIAGNKPIILMGDFNSERESLAYRNIQGSNQPVLREASCADCNISCTYTGFTVKSDVCKRIDFIFLSRHFSCKKYRVDPKQIGENYLSDHLPVIADLIWRR